MSTISIYIIIFIILIVLALLDYIYKLNIFSCISAIVLALFSGLRNISVGFDTVNYYSDYENVKDGVASLHSTEFGYVLIEKFFSSLGLPTWGFILLFSLISLIGLYMAYSRMLQKAFVGLAFCYYYARFFILRDMNQIRSSLASVIVLFSFKFVKEKDFIKFAIIVLLASSIHLGAIVAILVYPIFLFISNLKSSYVLSFSVLSMLLCVVLANVISPLLNKVSLALDRGSAYINNPFYMTGSGLKNPVIYYQIIIAILIICRNKKEKKIISLLSGYLLSIFILILCYKYTSLAGRLSTFTASVEPILLVYLLKVYLPKYLRLPMFVLITIVMFIVINYMNGTIPKMGVYSTVFS